MNSHKISDLDYRTEMGKRLRSCRRSSHLTQENMAELLDVSVKHYSEVERGLTGLSVEKLIQISDILGVSLDYLLKGVKSDSPIPPFLIEMYQSCPANKKNYLFEVARNLNYLFHETKDTE